MVPENKAGNHIFRREIVAIFTNQATLTYQGNSTNSNIAYGEILDVLVATKTAVEESYTPGQILVPAATYAQDPVTGAYIATPGIATLVVTGTI